MSELEVHPGRHPTGPISGPSVLGRLTITELDTDFTAVSDLFNTVLAADPQYLPGVVSGHVALEHWYRRKQAEWVRVARTPVAEPALAGHIAVRLNALLPDGRMLEDAGAPRLSWEACMLVVRPSVRGCGIGSALLGLAQESFRDSMWSSVHVNSPGHRLLAGLGWAESVSFHWAGDPVPGVVMVSPKP